MVDWKSIVNAWKRDYHISTRNGVAEQLLDEFERKCQAIPAPLRGLLLETNGLRREWFSILPLFDPAHTKDTWDDLKRANDPTKTKYLTWKLELLNVFFVFAEIGSIQCAAFHKQSGNIWYEESDALYETDLTLESFVSSCLRETIEG